MTEDKQEQGEPVAYDGTATEGGARYQADQNLRALLRYTENFYGAAIKHGMKAGETANAIAHIEKAGLALHELVHAWADVAEQRQATLAKQEPDYKALWQQMCERCDELDAKLAKQEQRSDSEQLGEPVAWLASYKFEDIRNKRIFDLKTDADVWVWGCNDGKVEPLYTTPQRVIESPQRTWVELTDDDWDAVLEDFPHIPDINDFKKIEAKLKEKNTCNN